MTEGLASSGTARAGASAANPAGSGAARAEDAVVDAWRGLLVAHSRLVPAVEADLRAAGQVPLSWYDVLLELNAAPDLRLRMSELGQRTVLSRTRVSRVVDELAAAGLAERQPDRADGRSSFAVLTPQGKEALRRAWPVYRQAIHRHLGTRLTARQCRELATLLGQVIATAEIDPPATTGRAHGSRLRRASGAVPEGCGRLNGRRFGGLLERGERDGNAAPRGLGAVGDLGRR